MQASLAPTAPAGPAFSRCVSRVAPLVVGVAMTVVVVSSANAQVPATLSGAPVQPQPTYTEPGIPIVTVAPGTLNPFAGADGNGNGNADPSAGAGGGGTGVASGSTDALTTLLGTSNASSIIANAQALGVNPSAIAATCVLESGCQSLAATGSGAQGMFQMFPAAYTEGLQTALAQDPSLANQIVQGSAGMTDPTTEGIAATGYMIQGANALENNGIANPTVLQVRSYFQFGPTAGLAVAEAPTGNLLSDYLSPQAVAQNNLTGETIAQWQASVAAKVGAAASQSVLTN